MSVDEDTQLRELIQRWRRQAARLPADTHDEGYNEALRRAADELERRLERPDDAAEERGGA